MRFALNRGIALAGALAVLAIALLVTGVPADAASSLSVKLSEFKLVPAHRTVKHGKVTFTVKNSGSMEHEMVVIRTTKKASQLTKSASGKASERGSIGEVEVGAGKTKKLSLTLKKGHYALICNIGGHYMAGMHADLTVK